MRFKRIALLAALVSTGPITNAQITGLGPALFPRLDQSDITSGGMTVDDIRREGRRIFSTPFNKFDGFGDGPFDPINEPDPTVFGHRPSINGNGTWLRANGLDSQSCVECHFVLSGQAIPMEFAVGGVGGIGASAMPGIINFDIGDADLNGIAEIDGRAINPPFLWGSGGVEIVAKEMTLDLQAIDFLASLTPGTTYSLDTHGVNFGTIVYDFWGNRDDSNLEGIDNDLVVKPFGRKGDNATVRKFDIGALQFHHGMQPAEILPPGQEDEDGDGVKNEILDGELSALHIFAVSSPKPIDNHADDLGEKYFWKLGCADCHVPEITTYSYILPLAFPEVENNPLANLYYKIDLTASADFDMDPNGFGVKVPMFSDLKRHAIGTFDSTGSDLDKFFITPRLWGLGDTAPYLHDGRALTVTDAILAHDVEAAYARDNFLSISASDQLSLLTYLDGLRAPIDPNSDL